MCVNDQFNQFRTVPALFLTRDRDKISKKVGEREREREREESENEVNSPQICSGSYPARASCNAKRPFWSISLLV
jgi:hypothetical protein